MAVTRICLKCIGVLQPLVAQDLRFISSLRPHFISLINSNCKQQVSTSAAIYISSTNTTQQSNKDDNGIYNRSDINANNSLYWRNTFITGARAMEEYLLELEDLEGLPTRTFRNAHDSTKNWRTGTSNWYLKSDIERRALEVWGSWQVLAKELDHRRKMAREEEKRREGLSALIAMLKKTQKDISRKTVEAEAFGGREQRVTLLQGSARVVLYAILSNTAVMIFKLIAYIYTGSAAMLSEAIHSLADVLNQCLLGFGIARSIRKPDLSHPYGFSRVRYVYALISGVGIFFLGAGVTVYHGITGLLHPPTLTFLPAAFAVLGGSLLVEGATLATAIREVQKSAKDSKMTFKDYVLRGRDPTAVAVLMEDSAAVSGVFLAASCLGLAYYTGNPVYDAIGSICIGGLLGMVALFLIQRNSSALVGRSIPPERLKQITDLLEGDQIVRSIHDVKATDLGADSVRFKAEINFDGREVARLHINRLDLEKLLKEVQSITSVTELEKLLLEHGEQVIDMLGSEVDRIEMKIKKDNPEVRHVDLEIL